MGREIMKLRKDVSDFIEKLDGKKRLHTDAEFRYRTILSNHLIEGFEDSMKRAGINKELSDQALAIFWKALYDAEEYRIAVKRMYEQMDISNKFKGLLTEMDNN
jgi:hypothetical protein